MKGFEEDWREDRASVIKVMESKVGIENWIISLQMNKYIFLF